MANNDAPSAHKPCVKRTTTWTTVGGLISALGLCAICCATPIALALAGTGGAFATAVRALAGFEPLFATVSIALFGYGFYFVYLKSRPACGRSCTGCTTQRAAQIWLWGGVALAGTSLAVAKLFGGLASN